MKWFVLRHWIFFTDGGSLMTAYLQQKAWYTYTHFASMNPQWATEDLVHSMHNFFISHNPFIFYIKLPTQVYPEYLFSHNETIGTRMGQLHNLYITSLSRTQAVHETLSRK